MTGQYRGQTLQLATYPCSADVCASRTLTDHLLDACTRCALPPLSVSISISIIKLLISVRIRIRIGSIHITSTTDTAAHAMSSSESDLLPSMAPAAPVEDRSQKMAGPTLVCAEVMRALSLVQEQPVPLLLFPRLHTLQLIPSLFFSFLH